MRIALIIACLAFVQLGGFLIASMLAEKPKLPTSIDIADIDRIEHIERFCASEKLDGQRGRWDGEHLYSRSGKLINAPVDFLAALPNFPLDGELYCDDGFQDTVSSVRGDFSCVRFHIFDAPSQPGPLLERLKTVQTNEKVQIIPQTRLKSYDQARELFEKLTSNGGEGIVLHDCDLPYEESYQRGNFYKIKRYFTGICTIVAQNEVVNGELGSYDCGWHGGDFGGQIAPEQVVKIGSGFSSEHRANPLPIGTSVQFKFYRLTKSGKPRHTVFLRVDDE